MIVLGIFSSLVLAVALLYWYGTSAMSQALQEGGAGRPPDHSAKHADIDIRERAQVGGP